MSKKLVALRFSSANASQRQSVTWRHAKHANLVDKEYLHAPCMLIHRCTETRGV